MASSPSADRTDALAALLAERLREAEARRSALDAALEEARASRGDAGAGDDEHDPEGATPADEWARLTGLRRSADVERAALAAAEERLRAGTYGRCAVCGDPIPVERLEIMPQATMCVACASKPR